MELFSSQFFFSILWAPFLYCGIKINHCGQQHTCPQFNVIQHGRSDSKLLYYVFKWFPFEYVILYLLLWVVFGVFWCFANPLHHFLLCTPSILQLILLNLMFHFGSALPFASVLSLLHVDSAKCYQIMCVHICFNTQPFQLLSYSTCDIWILNYFASNWNCLWTHVEKLTSKLPDLYHSEIWL